MKRIALSEGISIKVELTHVLCVTVFTPDNWGERRLNAWLKSHLPSKRAWYKAFAARQMPWLAETIYSAFKEGTVEWHSHSGWFSLRGRTHSAILR